MEIKNHPGCADRGFAPTGKDPCDKSTQRHPNLKLNYPLSTSGWLFCRIKILN